MEDEIKKNNDSKKIYVFYNVKNKNDENNDFKHGKQSDYDTSDNNSKNNNIVIIIIINNNNNKKKKNIMYYLLYLKHN